MADDGPKGLWGNLFRLATDEHHPAHLFFFIVFMAGGLAVMMFFPLALITVLRFGTAVISGDVPVQSIWRNCYELKEASGKTFKVDQCTGRVEEVREPAGKK